MEFLQTTAKLTTSHVQHKAKSFSKKKKKRIETTVFFSLTNINNLFSNENKTTFMTSGMDKANDNTKLHLMG